MREQMLAEFRKQAVVRRGRIRKIVVEETARARRTLPEAAAYGAAGAVVIPALQHVARLIEHKGAPPPSPATYRIGRFRVPSQLAAGAASGVIGLGLIPYLTSLTRSSRAKKKLQKTAVGASPTIFRAPHLRGAVRARVPEYTKSLANRMLSSARRVAKLEPGERRS